MPFEPRSPLGGFIDAPALPKPEEPESEGMSGVAQVATVLGVGAGLALAPEIVGPALLVGAGAAAVSDPETTAAAARTENSFGSWWASEARRYANDDYDDNLDPWAENAGTTYEAYQDRFIYTRNRKHLQAIRNDIDRENKDRARIAGSGLVGMGATTAMGVLDWPTLLPGAQLMRNAKGGVSILRSAASTAALGAAGAVLQEGALHATQQTRTLGESALAIGGSTVLAGMLGAGIGRRVGKAEATALARRIEKDLEVPSVDKPDYFEPGFLKVEAAPGASTRAQSVAEAIREVAREILPGYVPGRGRVSVEVVDTLGQPGGGTKTRFSATDEGEPTARGSDGADRRILRAESRALDAGGNVIVGRRSRESGSGGERAERTGDRLPDGRTEPWDFKGYAGFVSASPPDKGDIGHLLYSIYPEGTQLKNPDADIGEQLGDALGEVRLVQRDDGAWEIANVEKRAGAPKNFARKMYDAIQADLGIKMSPSGYLTQQGYERIWKKLSPESVKWHRWSKFHGHYLSPAQIDKQWGIAGDDLRKALARGDTDIAKELKRERAELKRLWDELPEEARAAKQRGEMFSVRASDPQADTPAFKRWFGDSKVVDKDGKPLSIQFALRGFYSPAIRAAESISMKKGSGEQFLRQIEGTSGVRKDELEWMGLEEFLKGKASVTRDELLAFMRAHQVELDEKILGVSDRTDSNPTTASPSSYQSFRSWIDSGVQDFVSQSGEFRRIDAADGRTLYVVPTPDRDGTARWTILDQSGAEINDSTSINEAEHIASGYLAKSTTGGATRFQGYKVPGGENYRELLIRLLELKGKYTSKHFEDQEIIHLRVDDRVGPNGERILFIIEVQSDLHQAGRRWGYGKEGEAKLKAAIKAKRDEIDMLDTKSFEPSFRENSTREERIALRERVEKLSGELGELTRAKVPPHAPMKGDLWLELALKRALLYAAENGYDAISWARSDQIAKAVGGDAAKLALQYDQKIGRFLGKYTRKWGGKVEDGAPSSNRDAEIEARFAELGVTIDDLTYGPSRFSREQQVEIYRLIEERNALKTAVDFTRASNPILRVTPEMRASVVAGQPLSARQGEAGRVIEGKFDPEKLLITIAADALDPVKTLKHESIHALRQLGLLTDRDWNLLTDAARKEGWIDTHRVRQMYQDIYGVLSPQAQMSLRRITDTPAFKRWFRGSKAVDADGEPLLVYHGTREDFDAFDPERIGDTFRADERGFFFISDPRQASGYATSDSVGLPAEGGNVIPAYVALKQPLIVDDAFLEGQGMEPIGRTEDVISFWDNYQGFILDEVDARKADGVILVDNSNRYDGQPIRMVVALKPTQIKSPMNRGTFNPNDPRFMYAIRAYHGGPHNFDRFDANRIGTGEGSQAFGYGLYFAEREDVAKHYQASVKASGYLYQVELDVEPRQLLDWDKPFSEQPPAIRRALEGLLADVEMVPGEWVDLGDGMFSLLPRGARDTDISLGLVEELPGGRWSVQSDTLTGEFASQQAAKDAVDAYISKGRAASRENRTGRAVYELFEQELGSAQAASDALRAAGVPGVRFLDRGSADAKEGTHNFVIFDDRLIKIVKKNGEPVTAKEREDVLLSVRVGREQPDAGGSAARRAAPEPSRAEAADPRLEELLLEEAIAEQFSLWRQGKPVEGWLAQIFQRLQDFITRVSNAFQGRGYQTVDDLFAAIRAGEVGSRGGAPTAATAGFGAAAARGAGGAEQERGVPSGLARSAGAAAVERVDEALKGAYGGQKLFYFQDPMMRLYNSVSNVAQRLQDELAETVLGKRRHAEGIPAALGGSAAGAPGSVETRIKFWNANLAKAVEAVDNAFMTYRKGRPQRIPGEFVAMTMQDAIRGTDALSFQQFKSEISGALRRGDQHEIREIAEAAKFIRSTVLDPLKEDAIAAKLFDEDVGVGETALSYLNRVYNKEKLIGERLEAKQVITEWLDSQETTNRGVRRELADLLKRHDEIVATIDKLDARLPRKQARLKEIEAAVGEVAGFYKFAFDRALRMRQPIERLREQIDDLGAQIAEPLERLSDLKQLGEEATEARAMAREWARVQGEPVDFAEHIADAADLDERLGKIVRQAEAAIEHIAETGDKPITPPPGRYRGPTLSYDEIDDIAAQWQFLRQHRARRRPEGLTAWIVREGGVEDPGGDILAMIGRHRDRPGLIRRGPRDDSPQLGLGGAPRERANSLDDMALRAWEHGFFPALGERPTINVFLDALRADYGGEPVVRGEDEAYFADMEQAARIEEDLRGRGIDIGDFRDEGQLRLYLGQTPSEAFRGEATASVRALTVVRADLRRIIEPYREQLGTLVREERRKARTESLKGTERGVFATRARTRGRTLTEQVMRRRSEIQAMERELALKNERLVEIKTLMEEQLAKYEGKSAKEATSAVKRRGEAEAQRTDEQRAKQPRLAGADRKVEDAARRIAGQIDKERGELEDLAEEIIDRIIGHPDGRLPYDAHMDKSGGKGGVPAMDVRGPLNARQFMIPDELIEPWLENDVELLMRTYVRTMAPDVELARRFGTPDMKAQMKELERDYARLKRQAKTPKEQKRLNDLHKRDRRDLAAIRDRLRGTYMVPSDPSSLIVRGARVVVTLNYMRLLGGMTLSALPDIAGIVLTHGFMRVFGDGFVPLVRNWSGARLAMQETKLAGTALDMVLDSRAMSLADVMDNFGRHTKFERAVSAMGSNYGVISLMAPWNAAMKQFAGLITQTRILQAIERAAQGRISTADVEMLSKGGISESDAMRIAEQFRKHGTKERGVWSANTAQWDAGSRRAIEAFRAALVKEVDRIIVSPGQERPLWMSTELGRVIGQFKSFQISAMQRILLTSLQKGFITRDMSTLTGIAMMMALGGLSGVIRAKSAGQPVQTDFSDPQKQMQFFVDALDRSGLTGWLMEANNLTEKFTDGAIGLSAITGKPVSRYASRDWVAAIGGPTVGTMNDFRRVAGNALQGKWNQRDTRVMRRLVPYNNVFYLRRLIDEAEAGINRYFGVPRAPNQRAN